MRKLTLLLAFSLSAAFAADPKVAVTSVVMEGHDRTVQVRNDAETGVTAFLVGASETEFVTTDTLLGAHNGRLLKPGEMAKVKVPGVTDPQPRVLAAIFEDGTTEGDALSVGRLIAARREVYNELPLALSLLRNENVNNFPAATVARWFHQWQERWLAGDPTRQMTVALAAEMYLERAGNETATRPARELIQVFEELSTKLAASQPTF
jgi:hypothetical protein